MKKEIDVMEILNSLDKDYIFNYKEVDKIMEKLCDTEDNSYIVDFEIIEGTLVDSYLIDIRFYNDKFTYCLFAEKYINEWNSGLQVHFIKDDKELKEKFPWVLEEIERMMAED